MCIFITQTRQGSCTEITVHSSTSGNPVISSRTYGPKMLCKFNKKSADYRYLSLSPLLHVCNVSSFAKLLTDCLSCQMPLFPAFSTSFSLATWQNISKLFSILENTIQTGHTQRCNYVWSLGVPCWYLFESWLSPTIREPKPYTKIQERNCSADINGHLS